MQCRRHLWHKHLATQSYLLDAPGVVDGNDLQEGVSAALQAPQEVAADTAETCRTSAQQQDNQGSELC